VLSDYLHAVGNLTAVQARCTALLEEVRALRATKDPLGTGWNCGTCGAFTGTVKEDHVTCRCCGAPRPA
jgi:hypothetical protein